MYVVFLLFFVICALSDENTYSNSANEQYRAGATVDLEHNLAASINPLSASLPSTRLRCPLLVLYAENLRVRFNVDEIWDALAKDAESVRNVEVPNLGHFIVNEQPETTAEELNTWLEKWFVEKA